MNLLEILEKIFGGNFAALASRFLGEPESNTKSAITSMLPALLGSIVQKGSTPGGASALMSALNSPQVDANLPGKISELFATGGGNQLVSAGSGLLSSLLGPKANALSGALSSMSGISGTSTTSLIAMAAPMIMGVLKRVVGEQGLNANGLMSLLGNQAPMLQNAINPQLSQAMGLTLPGVGRAATAAVDTASSGLNKAIPWIILILAGLLGFWLLRTCSSQKAQRVAEETKSATTAAVQNTTEAAKSAVAAMRSINLPSGMKISAPQGGFIDSLVTFVSNPSWAPGKSFAFDQITFETDSAALTPDSADQIGQLATVLKEYPSINVSVEGHTDNTGDPAVNKKLSEDRAASVKAALIDKGVLGDRVTSMGWGAEKPVASNDTEEGKLKNRRVEITLQKK
jgi:outer membrane protein OmpA-like peptidoglycan-associated protein